MYVTMYKFLIVLALINIPVNVNTISLKIDGIIELGPNWNIRYNVNPVATKGAKYLRQKIKINKLEEVFNAKNGNNPSVQDEKSSNGNSDSEETKTTVTKTTPKATKKSKRKKQTTLSSTDNASSVENNSDSVSSEVRSYTTKKAAKKAAKFTEKTAKKKSARIKATKTTTTTNATTTTTQKVYSEIDIKGIYQSPHLVKEDVKVQDFIQHLENSSKTFFLTMKSSVDDVKAKNKIDFLSRSYDEKFNDFVNETQNQKILTRLGTQKVILNLIDTSNGIMKRLVNYLIGDMQSKGTLRTGVSSVLEGQLVNEEKQEYLSACQRFGVCRTKDRFSLYAAEFLTEILSGNDVKIKLATGSFTEVIKYADYSRFGGKKLLKQIEDTMNWIDTISGKNMRPLLITFKNMLVSKNRPLVVMTDAYGSAVNKSVAFLDLVDLVDDKLPPTVNTVKEWNESLSAIREWMANLRNDATDIMQKFLNQFFVKAAERMKGKTLEKVSQNLKILFKQVRVESEEVVTNI